MDLETLKRNWITNSNPEVQARIWDRVAADYAEKPLPDMKADPFLKLLSENIALDHSLRILDIGCGAGGYTLALAPYIAHGEGVDISAEMIRQAQLRSDALAFSNAAFSTLNWESADIDVLGYREAFDVVFAHMTPAVADFGTLDKMNACSRKLCLLEKPTRRHDQVLDASLALAGVPQNKKYDSDMIHIFDYLWCMGYEPHLYYRDEVWNTERTTEDMVAWCADRARIQKSLSDEEETKIRTFVSGLAQNGKVFECTTTTRVTILWNKGKV